MNRNSTILYKTFSFLIVIPLLLLPEYIFPEYKISLGFVIGWIIGNVINKFWSKPLYVDYIKTENNKVKIKYSNPLLKKGIEEYNLDDILNFRIKKKSFFSKNGKIEFEFKGLNRDFAYLKIDQEMVINETKEIAKQKKTAHNTG